ncbi:hypothetical protein [Nocardia carnea]|nr:hypothetical protein [Nocardia carnea]
MESDIGRVHGVDTKGVASQLDCETPHRTEHCPPDGNTMTDVLPRPL